MECGLYYVCQVGRGFLGGSPRYIASPSHSTHQAGLICEDSASSPRRVDTNNQQRAVRRRGTAARLNATRAMRRNDEMSPTNTKSRQ
jgi:hypothetical protein